MIILLAKLKNRILQISFFAFAILCTFSSLGQEFDNSQTVGLVLSGGGAKSIAQIGAIEALEEAGIEIDYIGGTSMGSIIAAMYSLGYSSQEIKLYLSKVDWEALLENKVPRNRLSYIDRSTENRYLVSFNVEDKKAKLPEAFNYAQYILKELSYLFQQAYQYPNFKSYPIPFFCVATNIESGSLKVFEEGSIIDALRASSAFPSLFTPHRIGDSVYVDGGVINNFPTDIMKTKGVDIIIGIDVNGEPNKIEDINTIVSVLEQTSTFVKKDSYKEQLGLTDILVQPNLPNVRITDYDQFATIFSEGKRATIEQLKKHIRQKPDGDQSTSLVKIDSEPEKIKATPFSEFFVEDIELKGLDKVSENYVLSKLRIKQGEIVSAKELDRGMDQLYGSQYFKSISYHLEPVDTSFKIIFKLVENPSMTQLRLGLHYDDDFKTALLLNFTQRNFLIKNSKLSADFAVSDNPRFLVSYLLDFGLIPTVGLKFRGNRFETRLYENLVPTDQLDYRDYSLDIFIQSTLRDALAVGGGLQLENIDVSRSLNFQDLENFNKNYINYYGFINLDTYNDANYPSSGVQFNSSFRLISEQRAFDEFYEPSSVIELGFNQAIGLTNKINLQYGFYGAATIGPDLDYPYQIFLGSMGRNYINYIKPFIGYRYMELFGRNTLIGRLDFDYNISGKHHLIFRANAGKLESNFDGLFDEGIILDGYAFSYSFDSRLGPIEFSVAGSSNHSNVYTYVNLGFWF